MKIGHFGALCCAGVALVSAGFSYWDMQDGYFSTKLLFIPIMTGIMALTLAVFPGAPYRLRDAAQEPGGEVVNHWNQGTPRLHRRAWLVAGGLSIYIALGVSSYLQGENFFSLSNQICTLLAGGIVYWLVRKQLRGFW